MQSFEFYIPTQVVFGPKTEERVGELAAAHGGHRVLVVYGGGSAVRSGLLARVTGALERAGLVYATMGGIQPNPLVGSVRAGIRQALEFDADFLLAVGGGSVIDAAKAIADGAANPNVDIWDLWTQKVPLEKTLPLGCVLTIPAAGSEMSHSAVLTNEENRVKRGLGSLLHRPKFAVLNPELTFSLPAEQVSCGVVDIMMHTMDRYFNPITSNELTDELAEGLLRTVIRNGKKALANPGDYQSMSELMWAGSLSHNGLTGLGGPLDFATHQLGHELSAKFDFAHGATLAAMWGSWARYCLDTNVTRFARFAEKVWGVKRGNLEERELAMIGIRATEDFFNAIHMPISLKQLTGHVLEEEVLEDLSVRCTFYGKRKIGTFRVLDYPDILEIYRMANH